LFSKQSASKSITDPFTERKHDKDKNGKKLKGMVGKAYGYSEINRIREQIVNAAQVHNKRAIMITSPHDDTGNTFLVSVLGYSVAYFNHINVLLVDLNMRWPQLHLPFDLELKTGFTDIAAGKMDWKEAVKDTKLSGLSVVTAGLHDERLPFFLNRPFLNTMIKEMSENFDMVILDTSPVLSQNRNNVDPVRLSLLSEMVLMVVQDKITKKSNLRDAVTTITEGGGGVDGVIYNKQF
jgi:Mrp family chromosome partitioning ATPase